MSYTLKVSTSNLKSLANAEKILNQYLSPFKTIFLPKKKKRFVLLKSPHVNKKSKEHFQFIRYRRVYILSIPSFSLLKLFLLDIPNDLNISLKRGAM